jgi:hydroxymethylbilane synthase
MIAEIRGNVDTRLRKLENGDYDAIVLAFAGLHRLELDDVISEKFPLDVMVPAVGQGALGLETRADDLDTIRAIRVLHHVPSFAATYCEREVLRQLKAGCLSPVAAHASCSDGRLHMRCVVFSQDHAIRISAEGSMAFDLDKPSDAAGPSRLSQQIVEDLVRQGAAELIGR